MRSISIFVCVVLLSAVSWTACSSLVGCVPESREGPAIEYYILVTFAEGRRLVWPATAPGMNQTVVVLPGPDWKKEVPLALVMGLTNDILSVLLWVSLGVSRLALI